MALCCCRKNTPKTLNLRQIMKAKNNVTVQDQDGNSSKPLLPAVPFQAKLESHYGAVKVKSIDGDNCVVEIRFANPYLNYEKKVSTRDLELYPEHKCIPDSFNHHCPVCGVYCR